MSRPSCQDPANALLLWHVSGSLEGEEEASVREHLSRCTVCAHEVEILGRLTTAMHEHPESLEPDGESFGRAEGSLAPGSLPSGSSSALRWGWGLAAVLSLPALLGLYWLSLGLPRTAREAVPDVVRPEPHESDVVPAAAQAGLRLAAQLDLGGGPSRDGAPRPVLTLNPREEEIVFMFRIPPRSDGRFSVTIEKQDGTPVTPPAELGVPDTVGRHVYTLAADLLRVAGDYDLVLRLHQGTGDATPYRYPFRVEPPAPAPPPGD